MTRAAGAGSVQLLLGSLEHSEALRSTLALVDWWQREPGAPELTIIAQHTGGAADRVRALAPTTIVYDPAGWTLPRIAQRARMPRAAAALRAVDLRRRLGRGASTVYVADAAAAGLLHRLGAAAGPVVTHLHASERAFEQLSPEDRQILVARTDRWIVGSTDKRDLLRELGVDGAAITECRDLLDLPGTGEVDPDFLATVRTDLQQRHGIPVDAGLAIGIGSVDWWSVPDAFVRIAWETIRRPGGEDVHFLWIADGATERMLWPLRHDIRHAGLEARVHVDTGDRPTWHGVAAADLLVSSRLGDHQPAGHREAVLMGRPVLWFDDPTAPEPLVAPSAGTAVAFLDIDAMADAVVAAVRAGAGSTPGDVTGAGTAPWLPAIGGRTIVDLLRPA